MNSIAAVLLVVVILGASAKKVFKDDQCGPCDEKKCRPPGDCLAGTVKDSCGCCFICGLKEGERCLSTECGENMECRMRTDLPPDDQPEALCFCTKKEPICGSDGRTYANVCQLTEARYKRRDGLVALSRGPCQTAPKIVSPPEDVRNRTGRFVALACEAQGYPVPTMEWRVDRRNGKPPSPLPSDDSHVAVQSRGGPSPYEVTSWLQFLRLVPEDAGTYWCVASNELGEDAAPAEVYVQDAPHRIDSKVASPIPKRSRPKIGRKGPNSL